jgi:hypothetical protein
MKIMKKLALGSIALSSAFLANICPAESATLFESNLLGVNIGGTVFDITFQQFDGGSANNSFNAFYGTGTPPSIAFDFTTQQAASEAVTAILAKLAINPVDVSPAEGSNGNGFRVAFAADASNYQYVSGNNGSGPFGPFNTGRTSSNTFSMVFVQPAQAVPEPLTMLGAGTAIAFGVAFKRKLKG